MCELAVGGAAALVVPLAGVPVAEETASVWSSPLDVVIARKIQFPWAQEAGFGAVVEDGTLYLGAHAERLPQPVVKAQTQREQQMDETLHMLGQETLVLAHTAVGWPDSDNLDLFRRLR